MGTLHFGSVTHVVDDDYLITVMGSIAKTARDGRTGVIFLKIAGADGDGEIALLIHPGVQVSASYGRSLSRDEVKVVRGDYVLVDGDDGLSHPVPL